MFIFTLIMSLCFCASIVMQNIFHIPEQVTTTFAFAVFLVAMMTDGYFWGLAASGVSLLLVNYAFTFPYFELNFTIPSNFFSAVVMAIIAVLTSALTTKVKRQEAMKAESEREKMRANLLEFVRKTDLIPIIVLSARSDEAEKVKAFDLGANDYITKPFGAAEFLARVRSVLRFSRHSADTGCLSGGTFQVRDLRIEYDSRRVFVGDAEVKLTQTEYNILAYLSEYSGKVMTYSAIVKAIWGYATTGSVKRLQVNMANIRRKLGIKPGEYSYIVNELGVGYRMNTD